MRFHEDHVSNLIEEIERLQDQADTRFGAVKVYFKRLGLAFVNKSLYYKVW